MRQLGPNQKKVVVHYVTYLDSKQFSAGRYELPSSREVDNRNIPIRDLRLSDRAMKEEVTLKSVQYMAFDSLPGVCDSAPFRFCARQIVAHYVELLVLQDELRNKWGRAGIITSSTNHSQGSSSGLDALTNVNPFDLQRELNTVNVVAKKIVEHFSDVDERYEQSPKPQGCWRETLEGAFVALALRIKSEITGVQKIPRMSAVYLGNDVPSCRSLEEVASSALKSINHQLSKRRTDLKAQEQGLTDEQKGKILLAQAKVTIEAFTSRLISKAVEHTST